MLAFMPSQSPPLSDLHTPVSCPPATMSVAILPSSPIAYSQAAVPTLLAPTPAKRPKLTLDTSTTPSIFGKHSTSLRLETLSATSPTVRNTFRNGYNTPQQLRIPGAKPQRPTLTAISTDVSPDTTRRPTPLRTDLPSLTDSAEPTSSSAVSATSISTVDSLGSEIPYKLAYNITSILSNGPLPRPQKQRTSFAQSRPMFPAAKKVAFRAPLTEEISNVKYTMAHSDIESSTSTISTLELPAPQYKFGQSQPEKAEGEDADVESERTASVSPQTGAKRESSDEEEDEDSDKCPATPVAGRRKRHRQWRWTLGPVDARTKESEQKEDEEVGIGEEKTEGT